MQVVRRLGGNSGCSVDLYEDREHFFVRKVSSSIAYNDRLAHQLSMLASLDGCQLIKAPDVINSGFLLDGRLFYDMSYIQGMSLVRVASLVAVDDIIGHVRVLIEWIERQCVSLTILDVRALAAAKLESLRIVLPDCWHAFCDAAQRRLSAADHFKAQASAYHGDLTMENVMVDKTGSLWLIDPLDSYLPGQLADVSKLSTDLFAGWSAISSGVTIDPGVYAACRQLLLNSRLFQMYDGIMPCLIVLELLRAVPYIKDPHKLVLIEQAIKEIIAWQP